MNNSQKVSAIARSGVVLIGLSSIIAGVYILKPLCMTIANIVSQHWPEGSVTYLVAALVGPVLLIGTGIIYLIFADKIAYKCSSATCSSIERTVYRIAFAIVGLFLLTSAFTNGVQLAVNYVTIYVAEAPVVNKANAIWPFVIGTLIRLILGLYLFLGAPRLLGWHLKRCSEIDKKE